MRNARLIATFSLSLGAGLAACGGNVTSEPAEASSSSVGASTSSGQGGGSSATSSAATGGGNSASSAATTTTTTAGSGGPGGGPPSEGCPAIATLVLDNALLSDAGGDGLWSPGEDATLSATLENPTIFDVNYPGFAFASDSPQVTTTSPSDAFFVIFAASTVDIKATFHADAAMAPGTPVTLSITMMDIQNQVCPAPAPLTIGTVIQ